MFPLSQRLALRITIHDGKKDLDADMYGRYDHYTTLQKHTIIVVRTVDGLSSFLCHSSEW